VQYIQQIFPGMTELTCQALKMGTVVLCVALNM
jgi:hypothetical protein